MTTAAEIELQLEALIADGAEAWDAPGVGLVRTLLRRADELGGVAAERLRVRAAARVVALRDDLSNTRALAEAQREALVEHGLSPRQHRALERALEDGRYDAVSRIARRLPRERLTTRAKHEAPYRQWMSRIEAEAQRRGLSEPPDETLTGLLAPDVEASAEGASTTATGRRAPSIPPPPSDPLTLASAIYRDAAADTSARLVVAKAKASLPEMAGRYHAPTVAARALQSLSELAPGYLRIQVARLEALSALEHLTPTPEPVAKKGKKKRKASKRKPSKRKKAATPAPLPVDDAAE